MEPTNHKGSELNNVQETWNENERLRSNGEAAETGADLQPEAAPATELDELIKQEASEYDNENKEDRLLGGDRATVNDVEADEQ